MRRLDSIVAELLAGVRARIDAEELKGVADNDNGTGPRFLRVAAELEELGRRRNRRKRRRKTGVAAVPAKIAR